MKADLKFRLGRTVLVLFIVTMFLMPALGVQADQPPQAADFTANSGIMTSRVAYPPAVDGVTGAVTGRVVSSTDGTGAGSAYVAIVNASNVSEEYYNTTSDEYGNYQIVGVNASYGHMAPGSEANGSIYRIYANKSPYGEGYSNAFGIDADFNGSTRISVVLFPPSANIGMCGERTVWSDMGTGGSAVGRVTLSINGTLEVTNAYIALVNASNVSQEYCNTTSDANGYYTITGINATYSSVLMQGPHGQTGTDYTMGLNAYMIYANKSPYGPGYSMAFGVDANESGTATTSVVIFPTDLPPFVDFSANVVDGIAPLTVQFTGLSANATSWKWDFGDGTPNSSLQNPIHTFTNVSDFNVTLTVDTADMQISLQKTGFITVRLPVTGAVSNPLNLSMADLEALPQVTAEVSYSRDGIDTSWNVTGASLNALLNLSGPAEGATSVTFTGSDGYAASVPLTTIRADPSAVIGFNAPPDGRIRNVIPSQGNPHDWVRDLVSVTVNTEAPTANFNANVTAGPAPLTVSFTDMSVGFPATWHWDFGDGGTSGDRNPVHTYEAAGVYDVSLTVTNLGGASTATKAGYIQVSQSPVYAGFTANRTFGVVPLAVQFTDLSTNATAWSWSFGDGGTSGLQNPVHTYTSVGTYNVSLNASNPGGSSFTAIEGYITVVSGEPVVLTVTGGVKNPLSLTYVDLLSYPQIAVNASYIKGEELYYLNVSGASLNAMLDDAHVAGSATSVTFYGADGYYATYSLSSIRGDNMSIIAINSPPHGSLRNVIPHETFATHWVYDLISINVIQPPPVAGFTANVTGGTAPLAVQFNDTSLNDPTSWNWSFGDGSMSTEKDPVHTYSAAGTYTVSLTTTNSAGSNTMTRTGYIVVNTPPAALVNATITGYDIPAVMVAGESYPASVTVQNTGVLPWNESSMFRLGMVDDTNGDAYKFDGATTRVLLPDGANIQPGESVTFTYTMTAPPAGTYHPAYQMVWDGHQWFGDQLNTSVDVSASPLGAEIAITDVTIPTSMGAGMWYDASITVKNTGVLPWNESSMFRLGMVDDTTGDAYKFDGATTRILLPDGANVLHGESVTFNFTMKAPTTPGIYYPSYRMVWEGHQWFGDWLNGVVYVSASPLGADVMNVKIPSSMEAGSSYDVSITVMNSGTLPWNESSMFRLGMVDDTNGDAYKFDGATTRVLLPEGANVQPGESATFNFTMKAPTTPGIYYPSYRMVWEGHQWFGGFWTSIVDVSGPDAAIVSDTIPTSMTAGESYPVNVTIQNTGSVAWNETSLFRLGMVDDYTGDAYLFNGATTRVFLPEGANVLPGESVTFTYTMTAPTTPGTYTPVYQMVWDNHKWFGEQLTKEIETTVTEPTWSFTINGDSAKSINTTLYETLINCSQAYDGGFTDIPPGGGIRLEFFLYYYGVYPVTTVSYNGTAYDWKSLVYEADEDDTPFVTPNGSIYYHGTWASVDNVDVTATEKTDVTTLDVAPSILYALDAGGSTPGLLPNKTSRVVLFYVDALGYNRYGDSMSLGLVNNTSSLGEPVKAMCIYPSFSIANSKAMLTGVAPDLVKGDFRSTVPDDETMFDVLAAQGKTAVWVDSRSPPVQVNNTVLNADEASAAIQQYDMGADLMVVHFQSTDTIMHMLGPNSTYAQNAVRDTDAKIGRIVSHLDNDTVVIVWADHGCHTTKDGGDHSTLIPDDMYIPIFVYYVVAQQAPIANFTANVTSGTAPLTVAFTDTSVLAATWNWTFGDGTPNSSLQNPVHTYSTPGTYTVSLTTTNSAGSNTMTKTDYIVVNAPPVVPVNATITGYSIPASMVAGELYPVSVTVQNTGSLPWNESNMFRLGMVDDQNGDAYLFDGTTTRVWLPDGANVLPGESVTFAFTMTAPTTPGTYHPSYRMVWEGHEWFGEQQTTTVDVTAGQSYAADFTADVTSGVAWVEATGNPSPLVVHFTDLSTNASSWFWDFGDGTNSTEQNPSHGFANAWSYNVTLTVNTPGGERSVEKDNYINVLLPIVGNVAKPLNLTMADLDNNYTRITIENHTYRSGGRVLQMWATGASFNAMLDEAQPTGATVITFYGSDGFSSNVVISSVRADNQSMITHNWYNNDPGHSDPYGNKTVRLIMPGDTYGQNWCHHLIGMKVQ